MTITCRSAVKVLLALIAGLTVYAGTASFADAGMHRPPAYQPLIIKYQFTYHKDGTLVFVTTQDTRHTIRGYPCSPPAVDEINGNYSISCDLPR